MSRASGARRLLTAVLLCCLPPAATAQGLAGWNGKTDGVKSWRLFATPDGLRPTQSWFAVGSTPDGDIYVAGCDHRTNSALYRLKRTDDRLYYVGDARSASEAADNWLTGETAEKFHTRPTYCDGRVFVATMDWSSDGSSGSYLDRRGFHWYAYDAASSVFRDLSASAPGGVGAEHQGVVVIALDAQRKVLYGHGHPSSHLYRYDLVTGTSTDLGRPASYDTDILYSGRFIWVGADGKVYLTNELPQRADHSVYNHVHYYDPVTQSFGERLDWKLADYRHMKAGQWALDRRYCYMSDYAGHFFRFDNNGPSWTNSGNVLDADILPQHKPFYLRVFHLSADARKIYFVNEGASATSLYEYDIATGRSRELAPQPVLDSAIGSYRTHGGYDAWDQEGRFHFAGFGSGENVVLTRVDPVRLKVARGLLPELVEVSVAAAGDGFVFSRSGAAIEAQEVVFSAQGAGGTATIVYGVAVIPAGSTATTLTIQQTGLAGADALSGVRVTVIPNGNDYVAGGSRSAVAGAVPVAPQQASGGSRSPLLSLCGGAIAVDAAESRRYALSIMRAHGSAVRRLSFRGPARLTVDVPRCAAGMYIAVLTSDGLTRRILVPGR